MLHNTSATATFNGWRSTSFPERSKVQQGSPLSPLLYVIAAQPLASHLRRQSQLGVIRPITMPDGQPAPISHQHADDTSLHTLCHALLVDRNKHVFLARRLALV